MKKLFSVILVGILLGTALWYLIDGNAAFNSKTKLKGTRVVAFGDGLLAGASFDKFEAYPKKLQSLLGAEVIDQTVPGDTTLSALSRINEVLALRPDLLVVTLGWEDLKQGIPLDQTFGQLENIFELLAEKQVVVLFGAVAPPGVGDNWPLAITQLCKSMGVLLIDDIMAEVPKDELHVDAEGYPKTPGQELVAESFYQKIRAFWPST